MLVFPIVMLVFRVFFKYSSSPSCQPAVFKRWSKTRRFPGHGCRFLRSSSPGQSCHRSTGQTARLHQMIAMFLGHDAETTKAKISMLMTVFV